MYFSDRNFLGCPVTKVHFLDFSHLFVYALWVDFPVKWNEMILTSIICCYFSRRFLSYCRLLQPQKGLIRVYWKYILAVYCNFFLSQTHIAASAEIRGDGWLLRKWTCGRLIRRFDHLRRRASSQHPSCRKDSHKFCQVVDHCSKKWIEKLSICLRLFMRAGKKKRLLSLRLGRFCSQMIHHITLRNAVQCSLCFIFPSWRLNEGKSGCTRFASERRRKNGEKNASSAQSISSF